MSRRTCLIVNPTAGRGSARARIHEIRAAFANRGITELKETRYAGDEEKLAGEAIRGGVETLVAVGGDGTCARVAAAILRSGKSCSLAVVPCGTGNDFAKTLGVSALAPHQIAELVARDQPERIDVGRVDDSFFINSCGLGFVASVLEAAQSGRFLKGGAVYIYSALAQLFTYRGLTVSVSAGTAAPPQTMLMLTISNGRFLGGAFRIAPSASVIDGELDVGFVGDVSLIGRVRIFAGALRGTHLGLPSVKTRRAKTLALRFTGPPIMEVDGELRRAGSSTVTIECLSRALSVIAAPGYPL
ncbi:MAG: diacylglycerol kinase family lipid kinase [Gemmatimonadota bacterium]|nr:diacylglycerol kinase family lipid kinase [Gemmatimonadota bacterium]